MIKPLLLLLCLAPLACSGVNRTPSVSAHDGELIDVVSFETGCPSHRIEITDRPLRAGDGVFEVEVCGQTMEYRRTGAIFHAVDTRF